MCLNNKIYVCIERMRGRGKHEGHCETGLNILRKHSCSPLLPCLHVKVQGKDMNVHCLSSFYCIVIKRLSAHVLAHRHGSSNEFKVHVKAAVLRLRALESNNLNPSWLHCQTENNSSPSQVRTQTQSTPCVCCIDTKRQSGCFFAISMNRSQP